MPTNPGLTGLVAWWALDGNGNDSHSANHLTNSGASWVAGLVGQAADLEATEADYLWIADNAALSMGDIDFTVAAWVQFESLPAYSSRVVSKRLSNTNCDFDVYRDSGGNRFVLEIRDAVGGSKTLSATTLGAISTGVWYFVVAYHDATANVIGISGNGGAADTLATAGVAPIDGTGQFRIGDIHQLSGTRCHDGLIDNVCLYKSRVLTADEITWLYNGGAGRSYAELLPGGGGALAIHIRPGHPTVIGAGGQGASVLRIGQ